MITDRFSPAYPVSAAQGRHGELIVVQGNGVRPIRWDGSGPGVDAGVDAPSKPPSVAYAYLPEGAAVSDLPHPVLPTPGPAEVPETNTTKGRITVDPARNYYVARTDVYRSGNVYYAPPQVTYSTDTPISNGRGRPAKAQAFLSQSSVSEIRMLDGGKYYPEAPTTSLSETHGSGAVLTAKMGLPSSECDSLDTGLTQVEVEQPETNPPPAPGNGNHSYTRFPVPIGFLAPSIDELPFVDLPIDANGTFEVTALDGDPTVVRGDYFQTRSYTPYGKTCPWTGAHPSAAGCTTKLRYTVSGMESGSCAVVRLRRKMFISQGTQYSIACTNRDEPIDCLYWNCSAGTWPFSVQMGATGVDAEIILRGEGFSPTATVRITIDSISGPPGRIVLSLRTANNVDNTTGKTLAVRDVTIQSTGSGYLVAPDIKFVSSTGFGAYATCTVKDGKIDTVTVENSGGGYKTPPSIQLLSGGAEAFAVSRPHLRGTYQCYLRYVDDIPESRGGPFPSNLSPVAEVDCGEGATSLTWNVPMPAGRGKKIELWRSTSNQALTLYRVATVTGQYLDDLTDDELRDTDRDGYAAMPVVLPNGEINAMRFTPPPSDKSAVVRFQDRHWYAVDTGGEEPNSLYFSEVDEPESVPNVNELVLQENARDADSIKALIPYGSTLLVMQGRHAYSLTFSQQPLLDAQVTPIGYRGCLNQRCWEIHDGVCYVMDQYGIYTVTTTGQIAPISDPIENLFKQEIDFSSSRWHFVTVDPASQVLRAFIAFKDDSSQGYPTAALCYSLDSETWWIERYASRITCGTNVRMSNADFRCVYGGTHGCYLLDEGPSDIGRGSIVTATLTNPGAGYRKPPTVIASGGSGGKLTSTIGSDGKLTAIWITNPGYGYESGELFISPPDDTSHPAPVQAVATFAATPMDQDTALFPTYRYKSGAIEYPTDQDDERLGSDVMRSVSITYDPQGVSCEVSLLAYYNNSPTPRINVAARDFGTGFEASTVDAATRLDMAANTEEYAVDSGFSTAMFSGRALGDIRSTDRNIAVELVGASTGERPVTFYALNVLGSA